MTPAPGAAPGDRGAGNWAPAGADPDERSAGDGGAAGREGGGRARDAGRARPWPEGRAPGLEEPADAGDPEDAGSGPGSVEVPGGTILTDVAALAAERDEYLTALQRLQADFENYRKRVLRQQEEQALRAAVDLVGKVLPVLDTLDLAREHLGGGDDAAEEAQALDQARSQLLDVLSKEGLERVDEAGVEFDPVVHDAVATSARSEGPAEPEGSGGPEGAGEEDLDVPPGETTPGAASGAGPAQGPRTAGVTVDEVLRAGYRWRGQVLRPAMVRVRG